MDASQALADLIEICSQIELAIVFDEDGAILASSIDDQDLARSLADQSRALLDGLENAGDEKHGRPVQAELALAEGSIFLSSEKGVRIVAISAPDPISGLVLYDLSRCLRQIVGGSARKRRIAISGGRARPKPAKASNEKPATEGESGEGGHGAP